MIRTMHFLLMKTEMWSLLLCLSDNLKTPTLNFNCDQVEVKTEGTSITDTVAPWNFSPKQRKDNFPSLACSLLETYMLYLQVYDT